MRVLLVYESIFGNTRDIARAIATGLRSHPSVADLAEVEVSEAPASTAEFDLVVVGGPVHAWSMTRGMTRDGAREEARAEQLEVVSRGEGIREWLARLPAVEHPTHAAAFDTAAKTVWFPVGSASKPAARRLGRKGFDVAAAPEHFFVAGKHGPLVEGELERAREWGANLVDRLEAASRPAKDPSPLG